ASWSPFATVVRLLAPREHHMCGIWSRHMLAAREAKLGEIDAVEEMLARAKQHRRDRKMHLVDQPGPQIFLDGGDAAAEADILAAGGFESALERGLDAIGDEVKGRAARHADRRPRVVREHEDRHVIGRVVATSLSRPRPAMAHEWARTCCDPGSRRRYWQSCAPQSRHLAQSFHHPCRAWL